MNESIIVSIWSVVCYLIGLYVGSHFNKKGGKKC